jgi:hypothetical protein
VLSVAVPGGTCDLAFGRAIASCDNTSCRWALHLRAPKPYAVPISLRLIDARPLWSAFARVDSHRGARNPSPAGARQSS